MKLKTSVIGLILVSILISSCLFFPSAPKDIWVLETATHYDYKDSLFAVWNYVVDGMVLTEYRDDSGEPWLQFTYDEHGNEIAVENFYGGKAYAKSVDTYQEYKPGVWVSEGHYYLTVADTLHLYITYEIVVDTLKEKIVSNDYYSSYQILDGQGNVLTYLGYNRNGEMTLHEEYSYEQVIKDIYVRTDRTIYDIDSGEITYETHYTLDGLTLYGNSETTGERYPVSRYDERGLLVERWGVGRVEYTYQKLENGG